MAHRSVLCIAGRLEFTDTLCGVPMLSMDRASTDNNISGSYLPRESAIEKHMGVSLLSLLIRVMRCSMRAGRPLFQSTLLPIRIKRRVVDAVTGMTRPPAETGITSAVIGGVDGLWAAPPGTEPDGVLLYLHGGGYSLGSARGYVGFAAQLAAQIGVRAFVPNYRLAPEHPFPAALDDAIACYGGLLEDGYAPGRIIVAGDSAGGGLSLSLAMAIGRRNLPRPAAIGLICPWLDLSADTGGTRLHVPNPVMTLGMAERWARDYVAGNDSKQPAISPLHGDLRGLPPIVLQYAGDDPLAADGDGLVAQAHAAGVTIEPVRFDGMWHAFQMYTGILADSDDAVRDLAARLRSKLAPAELKNLRVGVVGAGMSGLAMGHRLRQAGLEFTIYEKAESVGGTWRDNHYPGLTCDVPSRYYTYSWLPNPDWPQFLATGPQIHQYFEHATDTAGLRPHIRFGSEITAARFEDRRWRIRTVDGHEDTVDVLVAATGPLHHPNVPDIPGLDKFGGVAVHSARWDDSLQLADKRVAVIGNGSTGVQIVTALAGATKQVLAFQRTPQWIAPAPNLRYGRLTRTLFRRSAFLNRAVYRGWQKFLEGTFGRAVVNATCWQYRIFDIACRLNLRLSVRDPDLRRALTPDYGPLCKRLIASGGFYRAIQHPDVVLITDAIDHVVEEGIVTADGRLYQADIIVLATGFKAHAYMRPMQIVGEDGVTLDEAWSSAPSAYRTTMIPGFPNLFMLMGPGSPVGNQSLVPVAETQADFAMRWIERIRRGRAATVAPTPTAAAAYNKARGEAMPGTIWASGGCNSWYLGPDGLPNTWPWLPEQFRSTLGQFDLGDYIENPGSREDGRDSLTRLG
jgi:cation diffusion facilitator CzcD-associated flavoprotein CzcO/acetyl esterase/lipase